MKSLMKYVLPIIPTIIVVILITLIEGDYEHSVYAGTFVYLYHVLLFSVLESINQLRSEINAKLRDMMAVSDIHYKTTKLELIAKE